MHFLFSVDSNLAFTDSSPSMVGKTDYPQGNQCDLVAWKLYPATFATQGFAPSGAGCPGIVSPRLILPSPTTHLGPALPREGTAAGGIGLRKVWFG